MQLDIVWLAAGIFWQLPEVTRVIALFFIALLPAVFSIYKKWNHPSLQQGVRSQTLLPFTADSYLPYVLSCTDLRSGILRTGDGNSPGFDWRSDARRRTRSR